MSVNSSDTWGSRVTGSTDNVFQRREPVEETLDVRKLNSVPDLQALAQQLIDNGYTVGPLEKDLDNRSRGAYLAVDEVDVTYKIGDWVVKDYDYESNTDTFRLATLEERKKFGLR